RLLPRPPRSRRRRNASAGLEGGQDLLGSGELGGRYVTDEERQEIVDGEHIRILSVCYYIYAGCNAFFSLFGLFYMFMGFAVGSVVSRVPVQPGQPSQPPPEFFALFFGVI